MTEKTPAGGREQAPEWLSEVWGDTSPPPALTHPQTHTALQHLGLKPLGLAQPSRVWSPQTASLSHPGDPIQAQAVSLLKAIGLFPGNLRISPTQFLSADRTRLLTVF